MRRAPFGASLLLLLLLASGASSAPQQAKKPKSPLSSGIDSAAAGMAGGGKTSPLAEDGEFLRRVMLGKDRPYNREVVDQIIRARGTGTGDPALLWKLACFSGGDDGPAIEFANRASRHFLGIRLRCAQCHDHPFDKWKEHDFYRMAAFFGRTKVKGG